MASPLNFQVVDVGARYGLHLSMISLLDRCETILIEIDPEEAKWLEDQYSNSLKIGVMSVAVGTLRAPRQIQMFASLMIVESKCSSDCCDSVGQMM